MKRKIHLLIVASMIFSCSGNILNDAVSKSGDGDVLYSAKMEINLLNFDNAITLITTKMSASAQNGTDAIETLASAYGGKCGLIFVDYVNALSAATTGSAMTILKTPFVGKAVSPSDCRTALTTMDRLGTFANRSTNQNFFMAILGMVLMGSASRGYIDNSPAVGDGTNDVNICTGVTDAQIDDIILGFGYMTENISAVSASVVGSGSLTALTGISTACQAIGVTCTITNPALITAPVRDFFRDLTNTSNYGVGSVAVASDVLIPTACP